MTIEKVAEFGVGTKVKYKHAKFEIIGIAKDFIEVVYSDGRVGEILLGFSECNDYEVDN